MLIAGNKENRAFSLFPFFVSQKSIFQKSKRLSTSQQNLFQTLYHNHSDVLIQKLQDKELKVESPDRKALIAELVAIDPWQRLSYDNLAYFDHLKDEKSLEAELDDILVFFTKQFHDDYSRNEMSTERKEYLSRHFAKAAQQLQNKHDVKKISSYLHFAHQLDDWSLATVKPTFLALLTTADQETLHQDLLDIPVEYFGDYRSEYARSLENVFVSKFKQNGESFEEDQWMINRFVSFFPWVVDDFCRKMFLTNINFKDISPSTEKVLAKLRDVIAIRNEILTLSSSNKVNISDEEQVAMNSVFDQYIDILNSDKNDAQRIQETALFIQIVQNSFPQYLNSTKYWFLSADLSSDQITQLLQQLKVEGLSKDSVVFKFYEKLCLLKAQELIGQRQSEMAEKYLLQLYNLSPYDYWTNAELGNYYFLIQNRNKAQQIFQDCVDKFNFEHDDCKAGLIQSKNLDFAMTSKPFDRSSSIMLQSFSVK